MNYIAILLATASLGLLGLLFGIILGVAGKKFEVERDERVERIRALLGGANCGGCGFAGCDAFAEAVVEGTARVDGCPPGGKSAAEAIAEIMGGGFDAIERKTARVMCQGGSGVARVHFHYEGYKKCRAVAALAGGNKKCAYACLGFGDCADVCAFNAISVRDGVAVVDEAVCGACGMCVKECPRGVISLVPISSTVTVFCSNKNNGRLAREMCMKSCIGCKRCVKECKEGALSVENNLAIIDYDKCTNCGACVAVCPQGCIVLQQ